MIGEVECYGARGTPIALYQALVLPEFYSTVLNLVLQLVLQEQSKVTPIRGGLRWVGRQSFAAEEYVDRHLVKGVG